MVYDILERYCKERLNCSSLDYIGISRATYYQYKKDNHLPLKHCKQLCQKLNIPWTDNQKIISLAILERYYNV
jgi:ACT domain-containing protein